MGRRVPWTEGSFFHHPASGTLLSKHRLDPATQGESLIETLFEKISVVSQVAGPDAQSKETNSAGREQLLAPNHTREVLTLRPNTAGTWDKLTKEAFLCLWQSVEGRQPEPDWCPELPPSIVQSQGCRCG